MRPDQERVRNLLTDTVTLLCKNGLQYQKELRVQGLLGITLDDSDVFVVHINETFGDLIGGAINIHAGDGDDDKLAMADIGGGDIEQHSEPLTTATASKLKHQRKSGDSFGSPVPSPGGQQIQQRPIKRLMTSTPNSSRSDKRAMKSSRSSDNEDIPVATSTPQPDVAVRIKTEKDVVIIDDKSNVQSCDRVGYPEATGSEVHGQYGHFNESLAYSDPSGDPGGGGSGVETAPRQQDYYSDNNRSATNFNMTDPGFGGPFVADMRQYGGHDATHDATSSTHDTVYTADGQAMVNSVAGCSAWDPSRTAAASRQAFSGTEDGAETGKDGYPRSNLEGPSMRKVVASQLLDHVLSTGDRASAFRVTWRLSGEQLKQAWRTLVRLRTLCDDVVRASCNVQFFVSSITGVYTRSGKGKKPISIYPGISYWVVNDGSYNTTLFPQLTFAGEELIAEVKPIYSGARHDQTESEMLKSQLMVVFKDHSNRYMRRRIEESMRYLGLAPTPSLETSVKIVTVNNHRYAHHLLGSVGLFADVGLRVHLEMKNETTNGIEN